MNRIWLSCLPVSLYSQIYAKEISIPQWSAIAKEMQLDAIDINALFLSDMTMDVIAMIREQLSLPVLMVSAYSDFTNPDVSFRRQEIKNAMRNKKNAKQIGAKYVRLTVGQAYPDRNVSKTIENVYTCFAACIPVAENAELKCQLRIIPNRVFGRIRILITTLHMYSGFGSNWPHCRFLSILIQLTPMH